MVKLGMGNSRMKDFFDIWMLLRQRTFQMERLRRAVRTTFAHRKTALPAERPTALTPVFLQDVDKAKLWRAFLGRIQYRDRDVGLAAVGEAIWAFLRPVVVADGGAEWPEGGPWREASAKIGP